MEYTLRIDSKFMETFGSSTLSGALANKYGAVSFSEMKEVTLMFVQTTRHWREKHGPEYWVMPEYSPMCFAENLLHLQSRGLKINIETLTEDPSPK